MPGCFPYDAYLLIITSTSLREFFIYSGVLRFLGIVSFLSFVYFLAQETKFQTGLVFG